MYPTVPSTTPGCVGDGTVAAALNDPRPLRADSAHQNVRDTKRELRHTLDQLERAVASAR